MAQFAQMQKYTAALHGLMSSAQAQAPRHAEGSNRTGSVRVTLGPDGLPESFHVDREWNRRISSDAFASGVLEAFQAAVSDRMAVWGESLAEDGWQDRVDRLKGGLTNAPEGRIPPAFRKPVEEVRPRPIGDVTEDVIKALDNMNAFSSMPRDDSATGTDRRGDLTITLSPTGLTSCTADGDWVSQQSAASLMNALGEALAAAKEELRNKAENPEPVSGLDRLFAEAMALLNDPGRLAD
jgi:hypothetical protein